MTLYSSIRLHLLSRWWSLLRPDLIGISPVCIYTRPSVSAGARGLDIDAPETRLKFAIFSLVTSRRTERVCEKEQHGLEARGLVRRIFTEATPAQCRENTCARTATETHDNRRCNGMRRHRYLAVSGWTFNTRAPMSPCFRFKLKQLDTP